jgi:hypothetical protein
VRSDWLPVSNCGNGSIPTKKSLESEDHISIETRRMSLLVMARSMLLTVSSRIRNMLNRRPRSPRRSLSTTITACRSVPERQNLQGSNPDHKLTQFDCIPRECERCAVHQCRQSLRFNLQARMTSSNIWKHRRRIGSTMQAPWQGFVAIQRRPTWLSLSAVAHWFRLLDGQYGKRASALHAMDEHASVSAVATARYASKHNGRCEILGGRMRGGH